jgi:hypothetical protein
MYQVQMQFIPGNDSIWVARLNPEDPVYDYVHEGEAVAKADELKAADPTERLYRVVDLSIIVVEETPVVEEQPIVEEIPIV